MVRLITTATALRRFPGGARSRALAVAGVALAALLAGCADPTGVIDDQGHNGYDAMACEQAKAFALDIEHGTVFPGSVDKRLKELGRDAAKASQQDVQQAAQQLILGYRAQNQTATTEATTALVQACQM